MSSPTVQLDPAVEIVNDDRGRIVLLPFDQRSPIRLPASDAPLVEHLRSGMFDLDGGSIGNAFSDAQRSRFHAIAVASDRAGLLAGRRRAPGYRIIRLPGLTRVYDRLAAALTQMLRNTATVRARGRLLTGFTAVTVVALAAVWWQAQGRLFAAALTPYWLPGIAIYLILFPLIHEFSHALVARLFGLQVTTVGARHDGGLRWSPFVEVRHAVLSSDPIVRIWIPLAGVICNIFLAMISGVWLLSSAPGTPSAGVAGMLTLLLHLRALIDGGRNNKSDASQALGIARELLPPARHVRLNRLVRGGHLLLFSACMAMLALSFKDFGKYT